MRFDRLAAYTGALIFFYLRPAGFFAIISPFVTRFGGPSRL